MKAHKFCLVVSAFFLISLSGRSQELIVKPYLQPGNVSNLSKEEKILIWQTDNVVGEFEVTYAAGTSMNTDQKVRSAKILSTSLDLGGSKTIIYRARLNKLEFDSEFTYSVQLNSESIASETFKTRTTGNQVSFVVMGDCCTGTKEQALIANRIYELQPDFGMIIGDVVYQKGLMQEYLQNFFPYYQTTEPNPEKGAPLLGTIPFYNVIGNHDVLSDDLDKYPDGLAYFYYHDLPMNAPTAQYHIEAKGSKGVVKQFASDNKPRYPNMANYSFENGNVQVIVLDSNPYSAPLDGVLLPWVVQELTNSKATWKIMAFHHPVFNSSEAHYDDQIMRLLVPALEKYGVDMVINGHVHNYQRSVPLKFDPERNADGTQYVVSPKGEVNGKFILDTEFDGINNTKPEGIIYIVSGGGGAPLYNYQKTDKPELWLNGPESENPFTEKMVSDKHSFTHITTDGTKLVLKQVDKDGNVFDEITVTK